MDPEPAPPSAEEAEEQVKDTLKRRIRAVSLFKDDVTLDKALAPMQVGEIRSRQGDLQRCL